MTKVRVSEETSYLSHSSNPISTVGLRNSSPYLMRSIRARGRTHCWVGHAFLLREQERERESKKEVELEEEGEFVGVRA
jgi:hypothetical protein